MQSSALLQAPAHTLVRAFGSAQRCCCAVPRVQQPQRTLRSTALRAANAAAATPPGLAPLPWDGTPEQLEALQALRSRMGSAAPDDETLQWFLRDRYFDVAEAEQKLRAMLEWRQQFKASHITPESVAAEFATGKSFVHDQTDMYGRPVLVITARKHNIGEFPLDDSKRLCTSMLDTALARLPPGGEQLLAVVDLRGVALSNIDLVFVAFMVDAFFVYFPRRVGQVLLVDAPWFFSAPWKAIKPLLRKYAALVRFVSRAELSAEFFEPDALPAQFRTEG